LDPDSGYSSAPLFLRRHKWTPKATAKTTATTTTAMFGQFSVVWVVGTFLWTTIGIWIVGEVVLYTQPT
jgi:hypothetical protein